MKKDRNSFFQEYGFNSYNNNYQQMPNMSTPMNMPMNTQMQANSSFYAGPVAGGTSEELDARISKLERQVSRLETRISNLEKGTTNTNPSDYNYSSNMYMLLTFLYLKLTKRKFFYDLIYFFSSKYMLWYLHPNTKSNINKCSNNCINNN